MAWGGRRLNHRPGWRAPVPVVYLSASIDGRTLRRAQQTAPAGYLVKHVSDHALRTAVEHALKGPAAPV